MGELTLLGEMLHEVEGKVILNFYDAWSWNLHTFGVYSIKSAYGYLSRVISEGSPLIKIWSLFLARVWKSKASSKVATFAWQLLQDRLPTCLNLFWRGITEDLGSVVCAFCGVVEESA